MGHGNGIYLSEGQKKDFQLSNYVSKTHNIYVVVVMPSKLKCCHSMAAFVYPAGSQKEEEGEMRGGTP